MDRCAHIWGLAIALVVFSALCGVDTEEGTCERIGDEVHCKDEGPADGHWRAEEEEIQEGLKQRRDDLNHLDRTTKVVSPPAPQVPAAEDPSPDNRITGIWSAPQSVGESSLKIEACPELVKPYFETEPQKWQHVPGRKVMVFSSYVERRVVAGGPAIRVIASGWQAAYNEIGDLYCQLWFEDQEEAISVGPAKYERIYPSTLHPHMWVSHFILCPLRTGHKIQAPYAVSISGKPCEKATNALLVMGREPVKPRNTHALCLPVVYNNFKNWSMFIEMFELHKILGADEIVIYEHSAAKRSHEVLQLYNDDPDSRVEVVQWPFPGLFQSNVLCQRGALNDCFYRMASRGHKYITISDLDEVLVPRLTADWPTLLAKIDQPDTGAFLFQHAYFRRNSTGQDPYLVSQQSLWRTDEVTPPGKIRCKSMYKSDLGLRIDLHFPSALVDGAKEYMVLPNEGMLHHYRYEPMETMRKYPERYNYIEDDYMLQYNAELVSRYNSVRDAMDKLEV